MAKGVSTVVRKNVGSKKKKKVAKVIGKGSGKNSGGSNKYRGGKF